VGKGEGKGETVVYLKVYIGAGGETRAELRILLNCTPLARSILLDASAEGSLFLGGPLLFGSSHSWVRQRNPSGEINNQSWGSLGGSNAEKEQVKQQKGKP